jgi:hypothetical protein
VSRYKGQVQGARPVQALNPRDARALELRAKLPQGQAGQDRSPGRRRPQTRMNQEPMPAARTLIYLPIVHTPADMGALKDSVTRATLERVGRLGLSRKETAVRRVWDEIEPALAALNLSYDRVRLYQDGLPVCGREAQIVTELAQAGSRNHQLLLRLMAKGATLMGTEAADLLVEEYQLARQSLGRRPSRAAGRAAAPRSAGEALLQRRDRFMARQINETLKRGETGILFLGMLHSVDKYLATDIKVIYPLQRPR